MNTKVIPVLQPPDYNICHYERWIWRQQMKKASRLLKMSGGEGRGRAVEKQQCIYCTQFVLIQAPEATNSSPHYRKEHKGF